MTSAFPTLDQAQEKRIAAVHGGFLYQHLFAVACLLKARACQVTRIVIERDEDVEIVMNGCRVYVQVKTRSGSIIPSDVDSAFQRFDRLRTEHTEGRRQGDARFVIATNQPPGPVMTRTIADGGLPDDVYFQYPGRSVPADLECLPECWEDLAIAVQFCTGLASQIPHAMLVPESLVWKLAGRVMAAATGNNALGGYAFETSALPELFEQLLTQLQGFPAPLPSYRPQIDEPAIDTGNRIRIVCGFSGAGKTSWCAQTSMLSPDRCIYFNASETTGAALTSSVVREIAGNLTDQPHEVREIFAPGASGVDALHALDRYLLQQGVQPIVVIDNAHEIPAQNLQTVFSCTANVRFILLCQPTGSTQEIELLTGVSREVLRGWDLDTLASEAARLGARGDIATMARLHQQTAGMPLYLHSAARLAVQDYSGDVASLCNALEDQSNLDTTAQQVILTRVFEGLSDDCQHFLAFLSMVDVVLTVGEINTLMNAYMKLNPPHVSAVIRTLRPLGVLEVFGSKELKIHDAMRVIGASHLQKSFPLQLIHAKKVLKDVLYKSLVEARNHHRLSLFVRILVDLGEIEIIIDLAGEEMFHEMGLGDIFVASLEEAASSTKLKPEARFWALDALVFSALASIDTSHVERYLASMEQLLEHNKLTDKAILSYQNKNMSWLAFQKDASGVRNSIQQMQTERPLSAQYRRILDYNAAVALWRVDRPIEAEETLMRVIQEYLDVLDINEAWILGRSMAEVADFFSQSGADSDDVKHLADAFELKCILLKNRGILPTTLRLFAFKFYVIVGAINSAVRVGLDAVQDLLDRRDFPGARRMLEDSVLPLIREHKLLDELISARSFYAVVLAYCRDFDAAEREMDGIEAYRGGFSDAQRAEVNNQAVLIGELRSISE
ncbi:ATP-binding protein [Pseudomonas fluorescens]|uniref:ORC1/DEAH AAA+ ATPase domain-containing protein n=1 Tax=Pseudomonas fluorescens TaxID=294 RepID=A0A5E7CAH7_PSEFL|nr:ATP-binding protein [Pseudomonas fluorescens]VVO01191.1 hypothetical protein PS691_02644 [Pseudomonas fluorescens]